MEVNGQYMHPLYKFLKRNSTLYNVKQVGGERINEDFYKFLIDKNG